MKIELGGARMDEVIISLFNYRDRLRIAVARIREHNDTVFFTSTTIHVQLLLEDMLGACENAASIILEAEARASTEAGLGEDD